jgi:cation-transporting ATPase 13A3/4/5
VCCFDKTGTLTKQGLDFIGFIPSHQGKFEEQHTSKDLTSEPAIVKAMTVCHNLSNTGTQLIGNAVDTMMFLSTGYSLASGHDGAKDMVQKGDKFNSILKHWEFDHVRMTMSAASEDEEGTQTLFMKGSFEAVKRRCVANLPENYNEMAESLAKEGCYVLAMAARAPTEQEKAALKSGKVKRALATRLRGAVVVVVHVYMSHAFCPQVQSWTGTQWRVA